MKHRYVAAIVSLIFICGSSAAYADEYAGRLGLGAVVTESNPNFMFSIRLSPTTSLDPSLAFSMVNKDDAYQWRISPGIGLLTHFPTGKSIRPFLGFRFGVDILSKDVDTSPIGGYSVRETYTDILFGPVFGSRYYISDHFAVSGEFQVAVILTDADTSASVNRISDATYVTTSQLLAVYFYF